MKLNARPACSIFLESWDLYSRAAFVIGFLLMWQDWFLYQSLSHNLLWFAWMKRIILYELKRRRAWWFHNLFISSLCIQYDSIITQPKLFIKEKTSFEIGIIFLSINQVIFFEMFYYPAKKMHFEWISTYELNLKLKMM